MRGDDRAVSEVLGFVLVFGIIIGSVGLLAFVGFEAMTEYQEGEQLRNAERGMNALADNFNDVIRSDGIDERASELAMRDGTITVQGGGGAINVTVDDQSVFEDADNVSLGSFVYEIDGREDTIAYQGGGVFRGDSTGSAPVSDPPIRCDEASGAAVVSLVAIDSDDRSLSSSNVQEFTAVKDETAAQHVETDVESVTITFEEESSYQTGWNRSLERTGWTEDQGSFTCEDVDRVSVHVIVIDVEY